MRYLSLGKYADSLKTYLSLFPAAQVRIYLYDDFQTNPISFIKDIFEYLGVDKAFFPDMKRKHNSSFINRYAQTPRMDRMLDFAQRGFKKLKISFLEESIKRHRYYKPLFKTKVREKLINYYAEEISELEKLLDKDLSKWRV